MSLRERRDTVMYPSIKFVEHKLRFLARLLRGIVNTYGVYQDFYQTSLLQSHTSSEISWIGTCGAFLLVILSVISGPIFDRGYVRTLLLVGTFLTVFGLIMTSFATQYWQLFLAQGLCVGIGGGCLYLPSVDIVTTYFTTKRAFATGITAAGGSVGSVVYPILFRRLQPTIGFGWATRIIVFIALSTLVVSIIIMKPRLPPPQEARAMLVVHALNSIPFMLFGIGQFLVFAGLYIPIFYIVVYAQRHATVADNLSFYLLSSLNAASLFGRIIPRLLADKFGSLNTIIVFTVGAAILGYTLAAIHTLAGLVAFALVYGFLSGPGTSLSITVLAGLVPEERLMGTWMGLSCCFSAQ
jgi:MFS family permease